MQTLPVQLVFLPPIGSDERAYVNQRTLPFTLITPKHIEWEAGESLRAHAVRYYKHLVSTGQVDPTKKVVWGGLSLGGALAQEFSVIHPPLGLILLGSFTSNRELAPIIREVGKRADKIPLAFYKAAGVIAPVVMKSIGYVSSRDVDMMVNGYRDQDKRSFRNAYRALSSWSGVEVPIRIPMLRIHGSRDPLIPMKRIGHVDLAIDTMHLVTLAKPVEVNASVIAFVSRLLSGS